MQEEEEELEPLMHDDALNNTDDSIQLDQKEPGPYRQSRIRWLTLFMSCLIPFGVYFALDVPAVLQPEIQDRLGINQLEYNTLYVVYEAPNIIMPLVGGYFIDYVGIRIALITFQIGVVLGNIVFAMAISIGNYPLAIVGRFLFGLNGKSVVVGRVYLLWRWFGGKQIAMVMGISLTFSRLGTAATAISMPAINTATGSIDAGVWFATVLCAFSLCMSLILCYIDKVADREEGITDRFHVDPADKVKCSDIKQFTTIYWSIVINIAIVYVGIHTFTNISSNFFQERFEFSSQEAGIIISTVFIIGACTAPFIGTLADRVGKRGWLTLLAIVLVFSAHFGFVLTPNCDRCVDGVVLLVLLGIGYALYSSVIWPAIPLLVKDSVTGTAVGIAQCLQSTGTTISPFIIGAIADETSWRAGYGFVSVFFACTSGIGVFFGVATLLIDYNTGKKLDLPATNKKY